LGISGSITGKRCSEELKEEILTVIGYAENKGLCKRKICKLLMISERRIRHWQRRGTRLEDIRPGPQKAPHALLPEEKEKILEMARDEKYVDDSPRVLAAKGADKGDVFVSASTVYEVMRGANLMRARCVKRQLNGSSKKPDRPEIDGANQRWCWDISYLKTIVKGIFLYLYVLLDEYSRKVVAWRVSWNLTHKEGLELIEEGLTNERLCESGIELPDLYNDRGVQMKAKPFMKMLENLGIAQKFSRPRTPNDNPYIESHFSIVKGYSGYPRTFIDDIYAMTYFTEYFNWYNNIRLHGRIGYVTPVQKHNGEDKNIIYKRERGKKKAREIRLKKNRIMMLSKMPALTQGSVLA